MNSDSNNNSKQSKIDDIFKPQSQQIVSKRSKPDFTDSEEETTTMSGNSDLPAILAAMNGLKYELKTEIRQTGDLQMAKMEEWRSEIQTQLGEINARVNTVESTASSTANQLTTIVEKMREVNERVNESDQSRISTHITVSGIKRETIQPRQNDAVAFAHELLRSLGIVFNACDIASAYIHQLPQSGDFRLTIIFHSAQAKAGVMRQKRERGANTGIYFDHAMTPPVRKLLFRARHVAKCNVGLKYAILKANKVYIVKDDDALITIGNDTDIDVVERNFPLKKPASSAMPPSSASRPGTAPHPHQS